MEKQTVRPVHIRRRHILARLLLSAAAVVILLPVVLTALYSFFSPGEIKAFMQTRGSFDAKSLMEIKLSPNMFSLSQYYKILIEDMTILRYFVNSAMYTAAILFGQALLIPAMAYALSRFRFRGRDALFFVVIMLMLLPFQVTMVPNVITLRAMGLLDTIWAIILPMTIAPFYIFLLRQYMVGLPGDMIEAAQIDGATPNQTFWKITLPLIRPILVYTLVTSLIGGLQMFDVPQILTNGKGDPVRSSMTVVMYLNNFIGTSKNYGRAGAVSAIMFVICAVLCVVIMRTTRGDDERKPKPVKAAKAVKGGKAA
mgnify:CR=1 FL=1